MTLDQLTTFDINELKEIHNKFYRNEYEFPFETVNKIAEAFVIRDDINDEIITFGAIELSAELVFITNKDFSVRARRDALLQMLNKLKQVGSAYKFDGLHCTIQNPHWLQQLKKYGFVEARGKYLYLRLNANG